MLTKTFIGLAGLGQKAELALWRQGILDWNQACRAYSLPLSPRKAEDLLAAIRQGRVAMKSGLAGWFFQRLPQAHRARALVDFADRTAFVDIETTGLSRQDEITTIAVYLAGRMHLFVRGINLEQLLGLLPSVQIIVTFNGTRFDLPFLRRTFGLPFEQAHLDLMPALRAYGYRGGQKRIEHSLGLTRPGKTGGLDGNDAVRLWKGYLSGNRSCLKKLLYYNAEDAWKLALLAERCFVFSAEYYPISIRLPDFKKPDIDDTVRQFDL